MLGPSGRVFPGFGIHCGIWEALNEIRDLSKIHCGIRKTLQGILDLTKIQCRIRETLRGYGI